MLLLGELCWKVMSTKHLNPDPEKLSQYCVDALEDMKKAAASIKV